jgi:hypothetical protein
MVGKVIDYHRDIYEYLLYIVQKKGCETSKQSKMLNKLYEWNQNDDNYCHDE